MSKKNLSIIIFIVLAAGLFGCINKNSGVAEKGNDVPIEESTEAVQDENDEAVQDENAELIDLGTTENGIALALNPTQSEILPDAQRVGFILYKMPSDISEAPTARAIYIANCDNETLDSDRLEEEDSVLFGGSFIENTVNQYGPWNFNDLDEPHAKAFQMSCELLNE